MSRKPLRILIVDDSPEDRESYRRRIARDSSVAYEFLETSLGEEGLRWPGGNAPTAFCWIIICLIWMAWPFWIDCAAEDSEVSMPVIMLTGQGNELVAVESLKRGVRIISLSNSMAMISSTR